MEFYDVVIAALKAPGLVPASIFEVGQDVWIVYGDLVCPATVIKSGTEFDENDVTLKFRNDGSVTTMSATLLAASIMDA